MATHTPRVQFEGCSFAWPDVTWSYAATHATIPVGGPVPVPTENDMRRAARLHHWRIIRARAVYYGAQPDETLLVFIENAISMLGR